MSGNWPARSTDNDIRTPKPTSRRPSQPEQDPIDRRLKRLREEVLPLYPFLLTVPTDVPFRLGNRFVNNWAVSNDGPFAPEEQQLQYMTFLTHEEGDSLLVAVGDWSDGTGSVMADPRSRPQSAASTPSSNSIKKKISLNDYKNKRKNGAPTSPLSQETVGQSGSTTHNSHDNQRISKPSSMNDSHHKLPQKALSPNFSAQSDSEHVDRKRPPDRDHDRYGQQGKDGTMSKKRRISPERATNSHKAESSHVNGLPALLSPTLPPTSNAPRLPRLLSPTLPPDLEKELARLGGEPAVTDSRPDIAVNSDILKSKAQKPKAPARGAPQIERSPPAGPPQPQSKSSGSGSGSDKNASTGLETSKSASHPTSKHDLQSHPNGRPPLPSSSKNSHPPISSKQHLIVKLKYGRSNRKRVEGLLKFSGKKKHAHQGSPMRDTVDHEPSHATKSEQSKNSASDHPSKMIRSERKVKHGANSHVNHQSSKDRSKEPRIPSSEKPQTPVPTHTQETTRSISITPAKDLKHYSSRSEPANHDRKEHSQPGVRSTPGESASGAAVTSTKQSPPQSNSAERSGERRAWKEEYQKYGNLGRDLKHAAERHTARDNVTSVDEKLAAATAIEAIICFILAFIADDQSKALSRQVGDSTTWLSIIAYWRVVKKHSFHYPTLYSLCLILGAVSYDTIHAHDLERLAVTPLPGEHTPVPTPGSDGHSVMSDESKRSLKDFVELKTRLPEFYRESQKLWSEGSRAFSEDTLSREFPHTWSKRARSYSEQGRKRFKPGNYSGEIYLPIGKTSTPLEIIRFSHAILREWCSKEGIDWTGRLDL
ncbi:hypothetical protein P175DRAFT_0509445 [Aspergillus ochraceoroseus IBT 24754]|uniref:Ell binding protein Ebp1 C-terminal domain-containing protein n=3 Tax=Aspergillus subgen. Nidulantes TaxID=2720870 RepID=A0A0F8WZE8_9EURO|nr:uncharacterized protein P175DRAFT_0509445 [Aspergillus ochraceoroseus IBT 24754]KKK13618.1 hypothetical protein AOCH_003510 [Aspergillus ochraceoroseus]KKK22855.1 hypothetical protein ARAM_005887 [Aspergillus rambellii]PTU20939.1 hypothetical protein P175DRAFT_0509445 [Aspergillus ochraceoroseus IBT 24754]